jgi:hypothetical protein
LKVGAASPEDSVTFVTFVIIPASTIATPASGFFGGSLGADALDAGNLSGGKFSVHFRSLLYILSRLGLYNYVFNFERKKISIFQLKKLKTQKTPL